MSYFLVKKGKDFVRAFDQVKRYDDGRTKESFKDSADINKIIQRAQVEGSLSHALKYPSAVYGEFTGVDLLGAFQQVERANAIFADLPSEVRKEFDQDAFKFAAYASDPANIDKLDKLLPKLAEPGRQFPAPGDEPIAVRVVAEKPTESPEGETSPGAPIEPSASPGDAPSASAPSSEASSST